jgi:hypothetical protein
LRDGGSFGSGLSGALGRDAPTGKRLLDAFGLVADCSPRRPATIEGIRPIAPHGIATRLRDRRLGCLAGLADEIATYGRPAAWSICSRTITFGQIGSFPHQPRPSAR